MQEKHHVEDEEDITNPVRTSDSVIIVTGYKST